MKKKTLRSVYIEPGCVSCGSCEVICPAVFKVNEGAHITEGVDLESNKDMIKKAAQNCPVNVVRYEEEQ